MVFHCATAAPAAANTANKTLMYDVNVKGTQNIIDGCVAQSVNTLVYTSSASVVFDGKDLINADESMPYAQKPIDYYTETKASLYHTQHAETPEKHGCRQHSDSATAPAHTSQY